MLQNDRGVAVVTARNPQEALLLLRAYETQNARLDPHYLVLATDAGPQDFRLVRKGKRGDIRTYKFE
jgi:hypothetical protein